jgi:prolyl 4-hydroxylase
VLLLLLLLLPSDYFHDSVNADPARGGQRVVTVLMYLATPEEGNELHEPTSPAAVD